VRVLRHFLFTRLKTQGSDLAVIQPYSGHVTPSPPEVYSRLALVGARQHSTTSSATSLSGQRDHARFRW
jgi:hypothetical protein